MLRLILTIALICLAQMHVDGKEKEKMPDEAVPKYLYKVLSVQNVEESLRSPVLKLPPEDDRFIHLAKKEQLEQIIDKYWNNSPKFFILKIDTEKLPGKLVFEANPGGKSKYYHLYNGSIPLNAIVESRPITRRPPIKTGNKK